MSDKMKIIDENSNNYHEKLKPLHKSSYILDFYWRIISWKLKFIAKPINSLYIGNCKFQKGTKEMQWMKACIVHGESAQIFIMRKTKLEINFQVQDTQWDL